MYAVQGTVTHHDIRLDHRATFHMNCRLFLLYLLFCRHFLPSRQDERNETSPTPLFRAILQARSPESLFNPGVRLEDTDPVELLELIEIRQRAVFTAIQQLIAGFGQVADARIRQQHLRRML